jgi:hypothetical protein
MERNCSWLRLCKVQAWGSSGQQRLLSAGAGCLLQRLVHSRCCEAGENETTDVLSQVQGPALPKKVVGAKRTRPSDPTPQTLEECYRDSQ